MFVLICRFQNNFHLSPECVKDVVLLIDQSGSIAQSDWLKIKQYMTDRVSQTNFTNEYVWGGVVRAHQLCLDFFSERDEVVKPLCPGPIFFFIVGPPYLG